MSQTSNEVTEAYLTLGEKLEVIKGAYDQALVALREVKAQRDALHIEVAMRTKYDEASAEVSRLRHILSTKYDETLKMQDSIKLALSLPSAATHDEVLAKCSALGESQKRADAFHRQLDTHGSNLRQAYAACFVLQEQFAAMRTERDSLQQDLDAAAQMLNDMNDAVQYVVTERDAIAKDMHTKEPSGKSLRVGDFVVDPRNAAWGIVLSTGGDLVTVYAREGVFYSRPEEIKRKPIAEGGMVRCIGGLNRGRTGRIDGVVCGEARVITDEHDLAKAFWTDPSNLVAVSL